MVKNLRVKSKSFLKKAIYGFLKKTPILTEYIHKTSRLMVEKKDLMFTRFEPIELFKTVKDGTTFANFSSIKSNNKRYIITDCIIPPDTEQALGPVIRSLDEIPEGEIKDSVFYVYFTCDSDALPILKKITQEGGKFIPHLHFSDPDVRTSYRFINRLAYNAIQNTWSKETRISHLYPIVHENICEVLELTKNVEGDYLEIGVYLGGSALTALNYITELKNQGTTKPRKVWLMDTFEGFNYKEAKESGDIIWADSHGLFGVEETKKYLSKTFEGIDIPYELVAGNICSDNLPAAIDKIAVANIDVDLYEPTLAALKKVSSHISKGGIIVSEDPACTPALYGAYLALSEFLESEVGKEFLPVFKKGQYFLIKL